MLSSAERKASARWTVTAEVGRFDEALDFFRTRTVLTKAEALRLDTDARTRAFWIGGGLQLAQVQSVFDEITKAIESGEPFEEWRKRVRGTLRNDAHAETVFRNATQRSYSAGRWRQMNDPDVVEARPYFMFDAVLDSRTTQICRPLDATILPADHDFWKTHCPPLHHRCRSGIRSLRKTDAENRGITNVPPLIDADEGFGLPPDAQPVWKPSRAKNDPVLVDELERKSRKQPKSGPRRKKPPQKHDSRYWEDQYQAKYGEAAPALGWGRAMQERALDRSAGDVLGELNRLHSEGHPGVATKTLQEFVDLFNSQGNRPLRKLVLTEEQTFFAALSEHTRTIQPLGKANFPFTGGNPNHDSVERARRFYGLTADKRVTQPKGVVARLDHERAYFSPSENRISFNGRSPTVYVHEWAHAIEHHDARALARSSAFLKARTAGEKPKHLGFGYEPWEYAREDDFLEAYMGKDYGERATEITSMGYEYLAGKLHALHDTVELKKLLRKDPDMVLFLLGQLAGR
jgi:SPP1 gp7 family putative phage head morphogenesis protein